jgi:hypothetical protein
MTKEEEKLFNSFLLDIVRGEKIFLVKQDDGSYKTAISVEDILAAFREFKRQLENS